MHQHLVDDDLRKERRREAKQLNDEGRGENLPQNLAVFPDRRDKPRQINSTLLLIHYRRLHLSGTFVALLQLYLSHSV